MNFSFADWVRAYARQALYGTLVLLGCAQALAQEQQLQEVVVTAQRREQNIQNVPIAITAFTGDALQDRNLTDIHALSNLTSGVNLDAGAPFSGDRSVLSASIRGIGQDDFAFNLNPGVGVYLDGVYPRPHHRRQSDSAGRGPDRGPQRSAGHAVRGQHHRRGDQHRHAYPGRHPAVHRHGHGRGIQPA